MSSLLFFTVSGSQKIWENSGLLFNISITFK